MPRDLMDCPGQDWRWGKELRVGPGALLLLEVAQRGRGGEEAACEVGSKLAELNVTEANVSN